MHPILHFYLIFGGILLYFGVINNAFVIIYFGFVRKVKKTYELAILILGIADFLTATSNIMVGWINTVPPRGWKFDKIMCKYVIDLLFSMNTFASYALVILFYVRYRCIADSFGKQLSKMKIIIASFVFFALSLLSGVFFLMSKVYKKGKCYNDNNDIFGGTWRNYFIYYIMVVPFARFVLPISLMFYCIYQTKKYLDKASSRMQNEVIDKRNRRILKTTIWLTVIFLVSTGAYNMYILVRCVDILTGMKINFDRYVTYSIMPSYFLNSSVNVIIYAGYMPDFRKFCYKIFSCLKQKK